MPDGRSVCGQCGEVVGEPWCPTCSCNRLNLCHHESNEIYRDDETRTLKCGKCGQLTIEQLEEDDD